MTTYKQNIVFYNGPSKDNSTVKLGLDIDGLTFTNQYNTAILGMDGIDTTVPFNIRSRGLLINNPDHPNMAIRIMSEDPSVSVTTENSSIIVTSTDITLSALSSAIGTNSLVDALHTLQTKWNQHESNLYQLTQLIETNDTTTTNISVALKTNNQTYPMPLMDRLLPCCLLR
jgi:hypothetical protein